MVEYKPIAHTEDGRMNYGDLDQNFEDIGKDMTAIIEEVEAVKKTTSLLNLSVLCEAEGYVSIAPARLHPDMVLRSGYIVAGDNIKETIEVKILYGNKEHELADGTMKSTEKAGKAHNLSIKKMQIANRMDEVQVYTDNRRKLLVNLTFEVEE